MFSSLRALPDDDPGSMIVGGHRRRGTRFAEQRTPSKRTELDSEGNWLTRQYIIFDNIHTSVEAKSFRTALVFRARR